MVADSGRELARARERRHRRERDRRGGRFRRVRGGGFLAAVAVAVAVAFALRRLLLRLRLREASLLRSLVLDQPPRSSAPRRATWSPRTTTRARGSRLSVARRSEAAVA